MESLPKTLNAPKEIGIGDKTYKMSSMTLNDMAEFEGHLKKEWIDTLTSTKMAKKAMYAEICKITREVIGHDDLIERMSTISGMRWMVWRCVVKHDSSLTIDYVMENMSMEQLMASFESLIDIPDTDEGEHSGKK